jgi:hypothetical protein
VCSRADMEGCGIFRSHPYRVATLTELFRPVFQAKIHALTSLDLNIIVITLLSNTLCLFNEFFFYHLRTYDAVQLKSPFFSSGYNNPLLYKK